MLYFSIGKPNSVLCIAEGYATGASIHEATGYAVAIAFDAGNLKAVALALRVKFPDIRLILCADDDWQTEGNPGLTKATEAAQAVGGFVAVPDFGLERPEGATDFNDMAARLGKEAVAACVNAALPLEKTSPHSFCEGTEGTASNGKGCSGSLMISGGGTGGTGDYPGGACAYGSGRFEVSEQGVFFIGDDKDAAGQVLRVARRFALVSVAGELATHYGLTGWQEGEAINAARRCFAAWLESFGGTGNREERVMLSQVRAFFEAHGASRFEDMTAAHEPRILNRAGFFRAGENGTREFLVLPESFKREICQGFDHKTAVAALVKAGWLAINEGGHATRKESLPGMGRVRCYVFTGRMWGHGDE